jgi:chlorobactene glucosyltransferase
MSGFWLQHQASLVVFLAVILLIILGNLLTIRRMERYPAPPRQPFLSVLIPARNEEANIGDCLRSLLAQEYPSYEVLVLDDHSTDRTPEIIRSLAAGEERLKLLSGAPLPPDWLGKHWACHQLAQAAQGELLLFTDADTRHHPYTLRDAVAALLAEGADMLTAFPREEIHSWAEVLVVPGFYWSLFSFMPLFLAHHLRWPQLSTAIGQFMLFRRSAFQQIGGYAAIRQQVTDDVALARRIKAAGLRWRLVDGTGRVRCRMYRNVSEVYEGFSKNLFAVFDYRIISFVFVWLWLPLLFWEPFVVLALVLAGAPLSGLSLALALMAIAESLVVWGIPYYRLGFPLGAVLAYPASIMLMAFLAGRSLVLALNGHSTWKGRRLIRPRIRWI